MNQHIPTFLRNQNMKVLLVRRTSRIIIARFSSSQYHVTFDQPNLFMNRLPPPNGDYEESQKDGNVGISVGSDDLPEEFPPEDRIVPPKTSSRATDGFGDQDTRQVAHGTNPTRANINLNAGN